MYIHLFLQKIQLLFSVYIFFFYEMSDKINRLNFNLKLVKNDWFKTKLKIKIKIWKKKRKMLKIENQMDNKPN